MPSPRTKPPVTQRSFTNPWSELAYLCEKIRYWLYERRQKPRAQRYLLRLERVLRELPQDELAILRHEGQALLYELKNELAEAIAHRKEEIKLMERLQREARSGKYSASAREYILKDRDGGELAERRRILAALEEPDSRANGHAVLRARGSRAALR